MDASSINEELHSYFRSNYIKNLFNNNDWIYDPNRLKLTYSALENIQRGLLGEELICLFLRNHGCDATRKSLSGSDLIVDGAKQEAKTSMKKTKKSAFRIGGLTKGGDYENVFYLTINENEQMMINYFTKESFVNELADKYFIHNNGGVSAKNDDYICSGIRAMSLLNDKKCFTINQWFDNSSTKVNNTFKRTLFDV